MEKLAVARFRLALNRNFQHLFMTADAISTDLMSTSTIPPVMDSTTLVTFLFRAPREVRAVELLGSWDNFTQAYRMHHDRRRGTGFWSGCFKFDNIIFDGESPCWSKPRHGGLRQGGTYWYYYRLDDEVEAYDHAKEHTTMCPLLPGQPVNVLDVPMEVIDPPARRRSASLSRTAVLETTSSTHTLNPDDKFAVLEPPPVSRVHGRCVSDLALGGRLESDSEPVTNSPRARVDSFSDHIGATSSADSPPPRHDPDSVYVEDRSSVGSSDSCHSSRLPNFTRSSVSDPYQAEPFATDADQYALFAPAEMSPSSSRAVSSWTRRRLPRFDFRSRPSSSRGFESFGKPTACFGRATNLSATSLEDVRSAPPTCASWPLHDTRTMNLRPATSYGLQPERREPCLYSQPNNILLSDITIVPCPSTRRVSKPSPDDSNSTLETSLSFQSSASSLSDAESFSAGSPTFTADTLSSAGLNTPLRLSLAHHSSTASAPYTRSSMDCVVERLRMLGTEEEQRDTPAIFESERETAAPMAYSLPQADAVGSTYTLDKAASHFAPRTDMPLLDHLGPLQESSFSHGIFSELSYLGSSIA